MYMTIHADHEEGRCRLSVSKTAVLTAPMVSALEAGI